MTEDKSNLHRIDRILDDLDHFQTDEERELARKQQRAIDKYKHLQPDYTEEDIEYF
jgi:hypothetical protein